MGYIYTNYFNGFLTNTRNYVSSGVVTVDWFFLLIMGQIFLLITVGTFYYIPKFVNCALLDARFIYLPIIFLNSLLGYS